MVLAAEAHHRVLGHGPDPAQARRPHHPRSRQLPAAARQHRPPRCRRVPRARAQQRAGRPHHGHLRTPRPRLPRRPGEGVRLRPAPRARLRRRARHPRPARRQGQGVLRHGRQLRLRLPRHRGDRGGHAPRPAHRARLDQAQPLPRGHRRARPDPAHPRPHREGHPGRRRAVRHRRGLHGHGPRLARPPGTGEPAAAVRARDRVPAGPRAPSARRSRIPWEEFEADYDRDPRPDRPRRPRLRGLQRPGAPPRRLRPAARPARLPQLPHRHRQGQLHRRPARVPRRSPRAACCCRRCAPTTSTTPPSTASTTATAASGTAAASSWSTPTTPPRSASPTARTPTWSANGRTARNAAPPGFRVVHYPTARGCAAAYYPETNVLVPLDSTADTSNTPRQQVRRHPAGTIRPRQSGSD